MTWKISIGDNLLYKQAGTPALDLRFATEKNLTDFVTKNNLVTFTRGSTATYVDAAGVIQTAAIDTPRFDHDPETLESLGLLVEESRTNLIVRSEEFDNGIWNKSQASVVANGSTAPDGTLAADFIQENTAAAVHSVIQTAAGISSGVAYTCTVYAKADTRSHLSIQLAGPFTISPIVRYELIGDGATQPFQGNPAPIRSITKVGNGWYRCQLTATTTSATALTASILLATDLTSSPFYTGDGTSGLYLWGAQLEASAFPTSYVPTAGAVVTRSADVADITGANFSSWYNQSEGTAFVNFKNDNISKPFRVFELTDGINNKILTVNNSNNALINTNSTVEYDQNTPVPQIGARIKKTLSYATNNTNLALNGVIYSTDSSVAIPIVNQSNIGVGHVGTISRITYWPTRLSDATLQTITAP